MELISLSILFQMLKCHRSSLASFLGYWSVQETELLHILNNKKPQTTTTKAKHNAYNKSF